MTERKTDVDGERPTTDLAPEIENSEQADEEDQAQTVADEAIDRATSVFGLSDSEKPEGGIDDDVDAPDLVDHMNQMVSSGRIDNSAYRGEDNHDDNVDKYGRARKIDDLPGDGSDGR